MKSGKFTCKNVVLCCLIFLIALIIAFFNIRKNGNEKVKSDAAYVAIFSNACQNKASIRYFGKENQVLFNEKVSAHDLVNIAVEDGKLIAAGKRGDIHLYLDDNFDFKTFKFDKSVSGGTTAIALYKDYYIGVINRGYIEDGYATILAIQKKSGELVFSLPFDLYASELLIKEDTLYVVGSSLSPGTKTLWIPAIMSIDLKTFEVKQEQYYDELIYEWAEFLDAFFKDGVLYCTARAKSNIYAEQIYRVNPVTLKLETFYPLPDETEKVLMADDKVYACVSKGIVILDDNFKESSFLFELDKSSFLENFSVIDDCLVVSTRKSEKIPDSDMVKIGDIYFWDINTGILKTFPLSVFPKDDIWNTIILPNREILF